MIVLCVGFFSVRLGIGYNPKQGRAEKAVIPTLRLLNLYRWLTVLNGVFFIIHNCLSWFELADRQSTLTVYYVWCFGGFMGLLFVEIFLAGWQLTRIAAYMSNLYYAAGLYPEIFTLDFAAMNEAEEEDDGVGPGVPGDVESGNIDTRLSIAVTRTHRTSHSMRHGLK